MSVLEERYRRVLRLLPASYRARREEEMVSAFLDGARRAETDLDDQRVRWAEIAGVAALALRVRLGGPGSPPGEYATGEAVRGAAILGLVFWTMLGALFAAQTVLTYGVVAGVLPDGLMGIGDPGSPERLRQVLSGLAPLLWAASLGALVRGRAGTAKASAWAALVLPYALDPGAAGGPGWIAGLLTALPALVTALALTAGFHRDAPPPRLPGATAARVVAVPVAAGVLLALAVGALGAAARAGGEPGPLMLQPWLWLDPAGLACVSLLAVTAWLVLRRPALRASATPAPASAPPVVASGSVAPAAAILTVPTVVARAATLHPGAEGYLSGLITLVGALQLALLLACGVTLVALTVRTPGAAARDDLTGTREQPG
ncbi:hypothetical protein [Microbispora amethystogenes]|uniref:Integral membrane protein n=1 Tax=Microbispora amethystogenes TaxID=1427754 RepID=A0ABQ4FN16_9ACTN|nr:hypothetical protein [Microbispora amethystogenes]GIH36210.1 hypothetical protein Mam01_63740 [Microbispora amethystogenes]